MLKKILLKIINLISIVVILISLAVLLTVVLTKKGEAPNVFGYSLFRVMTGSMEPAIPTDSMIVVKRSGKEEYLPGDVISFYSRDPALGGAVNTHRITEVRREDGIILYETRGDANNAPDRYPVLQEDVIGKVVYASYGLGKAVRLISNPILFIPLIILPLILILGQSVWESFKLARKLAQEEEEAAVREALENLRKKKSLQSGENEADSGKSRFEGKEDTRGVM